MADAASAIVPLGGPSPAEITHGWIFLGMMLNVFLFGIMVTQTYLYYTTYVNDKLYIKIVVAVLFVADTANSIFGIVYLYDALITNFANPAFLNNVTFAFQTDPAMTGIIAGIVQGFFAHRVRVLTGSNIISGAIFLLALTTAGTGIGTSIKAGISPQFTKFNDFKELVVVWLLSAAVADCIITFTLVYSLRNRKTGFKVTDGVINRIIVLTVQTGMFTAIAAVINTATFLWVPTGLHLLFNMPLSKLYTNSMMSSLNARGGWKFTNATSSGVDSSASQVLSKPDPHHRRAPGQTNVVQLNRGTESRDVPGVFVTVEQHEMRDRSDSMPKRPYDDEPYRGEPLKSTLDMRGGRGYNIV